MVLNSVSVNTNSNTWLFLTTLDNTSRRSFQAFGETRKDARSAKRGPPLPNPHTYYSLGTLRASRVFSCRSHTIRTPGTGFALRARRTPLLPSHSASATHATAVVNYAPIRYLKTRKWKLLWIVRQSDIKKCFVSINVACERVNVLQLAFIFCFVITFQAVASSCGAIVSCLNCFPFNEAESRKHNGSSFLMCYCAFNNTRNPTYAYDCVLLCRQS